MRAFTAVLVLALLLGALPAVAQGPALEMRVDPFRVEMAPGTRFNGELTLRNPDASNTTTTITVGSQPSGLLVHLFETNVALASYETKRVGFYVFAPTTHPAKEVLVEFQASGRQAYLIVNVTADAPEGYDAGLLPATDVSSVGAAVTDGGRYEGRILVTNLNETARTFPVRVRAPQGWTVNVTPTSLALGPRQSAYVDVRGDPTPQAVNASGVIEIGPPLVHTAVNLHLNVTRVNATKPAFARVELDAATIDLAPNASATVRVSIANEGDAPWSGQVRAVVGGGLRVEGPFSASAPPRGSVVLDYVVRSNATVAGTSSVRFETEHTNATLAVNLLAPAPQPLSVTLDPAVVNVEAGAQAVVRLIAQNKEDAPWSGPLAIVAPEGIEVDGPRTLDVPARTSALVDYTIRVDPLHAPGATAIRFRASPASNEAILDVTVLPPAPPKGVGLHVTIDPPEISLLASERVEINVTVRNDGGADYEGDLAIAAPVGVSIQGNTSIEVPAGRSLSVRLAVFATADGVVTIAAGDASATLAVRIVDDEPAPLLAIALDPEALDLAVGESRLVRVTVAHASGDAWQGILSIRALGNASATPLTTTLLDLAPGASRSVNVRVSRTGEGAAAVEFDALDATARLPLDDVDPSISEADVGGVGAISPPVAAALVAAGVGAAAGSVALGQRRWPLVFAGLYARLAPSRLLEHPMRARIRRLVDESPGVTRNEMGRRLGLAPGALDHHLSKLVSGGFLVAVPDGQMRRFFVAGSARPEARAALDERIVAHLRAHGPSSAADVAQALGASRQALHYHLRRMTREGAVVVERGPGGLTLRAP